jgi:endogenous inhibitor of DNA gyrase (YacG/DUF329 family)
MSCPICKSPTEPEHRPFCSERCKDIDLSKWLIGGYVIANDDESDGCEVGRDADDPEI